MDERRGKAACPRPGRARRAGQGPQRTGVVTVAPAAAPAGAPRSPQEVLTGPAALALHRFPRRVSADAWRAGPPSSSCPRSCGHHTHYWSLCDDKWRDIGLGVGDTYEQELPLPPPHWASQPTEDKGLWEDEVSVQPRSEHTAVGRPPQGKLVLSFSVAIIVRKSEERGQTCARRALRRWRACGRRLAQVSGTHVPSTRGRSSPGLGPRPGAIRPL